MQRSFVSLKRDERDEEDDGYDSDIISILFAQSSERCHFRHNRSYHFRTTRLFASDAFNVSYTRAPSETLKVRPTRGLTLISSRFSSFRRVAHTLKGPLGA